MDAEIAAPLQSLDEAIAEALRNGATPDEISRVLSKASKKHRKESEGSIGLSRNAYRCALLVFALTIAITNILTSSSFVSPMAVIQVEEKDFDAPTTQSSEWEEAKELPIHSSLPKVNRKQTFEDQEIALVTRANKKSRTRMILDYEKRDIDFQIDVLGVKKGQLMYPCPMDAFFHEGCEERGGGKVCIYPKAILKRIKADSLDQEFTAFERLTDTRFFPKLYYADERCRTVLQENVRPAGETQNMFCSNYTVYEDFYKGAFKIFNQQNIIPIDLNTCCNTIVNGDQIRIIDFGKYTFDESPERVHEFNKELLEKILEDVKKMIKEHKNRCLKRQWDTDRKKEKERRKKKERAMAANQTAESLEIIKKTQQEYMEKTKPKK